MKQLTFLIILLAFGAINIYAHVDGSYMGFSACVVPFGNDNDFQLYQFHGQFNFHDFYKGEKTQIHLGVGGATGFLLGKYDTKSFLINGNIALSNAFWNEKLTLTLGTGPALISFFRFSRNLGSYLQFIHYAEIRSLIYWKIGLGLRIQHMSNANLGKENPGLNMILVELNYYF